MTKTRTPTSQEYGFNQNNRLFTFTRITTYSVLLRLLDKKYIILFIIKLLRTA